MPSYWNSRTGAVIETASVCAGGDWEPVKEIGAKPATTSGKKTAAKKQQSKKKRCDNAAEKEGRESDE